jgi:hypothetical protein
MKVCRSGCWRSVIGSSAHGRLELGDAVPLARKSAERVAPVLGPYLATTHDWLTAHLDAAQAAAHRSPGLAATD